MAKSISDNQKKVTSRGRPKTTGTTPMTGVRLSSQLEAAVLKWARSQDDKPNKAEAIRRLVEKGLGSEVARKQSSPEAAHKAQKMAARTVDHMGDKSATGEERASRKRRLIRGPGEFRDMRADLPKAKKKP